MKTAQDYIKTDDGNVRGGFNSRLQGVSRTDNLRGAVGSIWAGRYAGWERANQMIKDGEIFSEVKGVGVVKCFRDGSAWCCVGEGFENLQESDNYAFGDTRIEAIENYMENPND